jgi:hypothetical protein
MDHIYKLFAFVYYCCIIKYSLCIEIFVVVDFFSTLTIRLIQKNYRKHVLNKSCLKYIQQ